MIEDFYFIWWEEEEEEECNLKSQLDLSPMES